jgi:hypothetical protein
MPVYANTTERSSKPLPPMTDCLLIPRSKGRIWGACFNGGIFYIYNDSVHTIGANHQLKKNANDLKEIIRKIILDKNNILHVGTTHNYYQLELADQFTALNPYSVCDTNFTLMKEIGNDLLFARIDCELGPQHFPKLKYVFDTEDKDFFIYLDYQPKKAVNPHYYGIKTPTGGFLFIL